MKKFILLVLVLILSYSFYFPECPKCSALEHKIEKLSNEIDNVAEYLDNINELGKQSSLQEDDIIKIEEEIIEFTKDAYTSLEKMENILLE